MKLGFYEYQKHKKNEYKNMSVNYVLKGVIQRTRM